MLPPLREELTLFPGPSTIDGAPTWSLHDPARNAFFQIDWLTFEILARWHLGKAQPILGAIADETAIQPESGDIDAVLRFLVENELVCSHDAEGTARMSMQARRRRSRPGEWLLHKYLFFRIPLWRPDRWLGMALPWVEPLFSRTFLWLTAAALLMGLVETSRQWEIFVATLVDTFSLQGVAGFLLALVFAKVMHELGHAFTAKRFGCRVPSMGIAFLVLFPMAYTDVNEVWKLQSHRRRLAVGMAGVCTELIIAAWATLVWAVSPDGLVRDAAFILATATWIATVLVNASPFMRFDGYFVLMDWLGMPNLHQRAFALGRWRLREVLFAPADEPPERMPQGRHRLLIGFAYATWLYRLVVFSGIAVLVYHVFPKPLGPFLAVVELWWFVFSPAWREVREWGGCMRRAKSVGRLAGLVAILAMLVVAGFAPWDARIHTQGILRPAGYFSIIVPEPARVTGMPIGHAQRVRRDAVLFELKSPNLELEASQKQVQASTATWQSVTAGVSSDLRENIRVIESARARLDAEMVGIDAEKDRLIIRAPADGTLFLDDLDLHVGQWVGRNEKLATLLDSSSWQVVTYLPEAAIGRIAVGDEAVFYFEHSGGEKLALEVESIDKDATRVLPDAMLASTAGGAIMVRDTAQGLVPETARYRVALSLAPGQQLPQPRLHRGNVVLFGAPKPLLDDFFRSAAALFIRELGF